jgi:predicted N-formylglutamate amidohydrolase
VAGLVLSCEHASSALPPGFDPGVGEAALASHLAFDAGALEAAEVVRSRLGAPLFAGRWSRLYVDLNRSPAGAIPTESCRVPVPGNVGLSPAERTARLTLVEAHHDAVRAAVAGVIERAGACLHLSIHSFTPALHGVERPYDAGVLFDPVRPLEVAAASALLDGLRAAGRTARANEPYLGTEDGLTTRLRTCFDPARYAGLEVELNQALVARGEAAALGALVADLVPAALAAVARSSS